MRLEVEGLTRTYGSRRAVDGLQFSLPAGQIVALLGPNGAGKSTTMRILAGIQEADAGTVRVDGVDILADREAARRLVALTPQELSLFDALTARETLSLVVSLRAGDLPDAAARVETWLATTGLTEAAGRLVREFSGGMKRRLAIATALITAPPLVILDESFVGLDPQSVRAVETALRTYCAQGGTVLLSSHMLDLVERLVDRVLLLHRGMLIADLDRDALAATIPAEFPTLVDWYLACTGAAPGGDAPAPRPAPGPADS